MGYRRCVRTGTTLVILSFVVCAIPACHRTADPAFDRSEPARVAESSPDRSTAGPAVPRPSEPGPSEPGSAHPPAGSISRGSTDAVWESPTHGAACSLNYLPAGVPFVLVWRPAAMTGCDGHDLILRALGPDFAALAANWLTMVNASWAEIPQLTIALLPENLGPPRVFLVAEMDPAYTWPSWWHTEGQLGSGPAVYRRHQGWCFAAPPGADRRLMLMGRSDDLVSVLDDPASPPVLHRAMLDLLRLTDENRHLTILAVPSFLYGDAQPMFAASHAPWPSMLQEYMGSEVQAVSMSMHFDQYWFTELRGVPAIGLPPATLTLQLQRRISALPQRVAQHLQRITIFESWKKLAERYPRMIQFACDHVRFCPHMRSVQATMALPLPAAHNILLGADLALQSAVDSRTDNRTEPQRDGGASERDRKVDRREGS